MPASLGPRGCFLKPAIFDEGVGKDAPFLMSLPFLLFCRATIELDPLNGLSLHFRRFRTKAKLYLGPTGALSIRVQLNDFTDQMCKNLGHSLQHLSDFGEHEILQSSVLQTGQGDQARSSSQVNEPEFSAQQQKTSLKISENKSTRTTTTSRQSEISRDSTLSVATSPQNTRSDGLQQSGQRHRDRQLATDSEAASHRGEQSGQSLDQLEGAREEGTGVHPQLPGTPWAAGPAQFPSNACNHVKDDCRGPGGSQPNSRDNGSPERSSRDPREPVRGVHELQNGEAGQTVRGTLRSKGEPQPKQLGRERPLIELERGAGEQRQRSRGTSRLGECELPESDNPEESSGSVQEHRATKDEQGRGASERDGEELHALQDNETRQQPLRDHHDVQVLRPGTRENEDSAGHRVRREEDQGEGDQVGHRQREGEGQEATALSPSQVRHDPVGARRLDGAVQPVARHPTPRGNPGDAQGREEGRAGASHASLVDPDSTEAEPKPSTATAWHRSFRQRLASELDASTQRHILGCLKKAEAAWHEVFQLLLQSHPTSNVDEKMGAL